MTVILAKYQRQLLRTIHDQARREVAHLYRREYFPVPPARLRFLEAKELRSQLANQFAGCALDGETDDANYVLQVLRVADRYLTLCTNAYLGAPTAVAS